MAVDLRVVLLIVVLAGACLGFGAGVWYSMNTAHDACLQECLSANPLTQCVSTPVNYSNMRVKGGLNELVE